MKKHPKIFRSGSGTRGFSLVLSLTVMAMLLLICIGAASMLAVELRVGRASASVAKARLNALVGARIAYGEVQRLLGPDQRVSATADILATKRDGTDLNHPRWTGVWHSGTTANDWSGRGPVLTRNAAEGYLTDARFISQHQWTTDRAKSKRMLGWLVSGNEAKATTDSDYLRPDSPVTTDDELVLGAGTLGTNLSATSGGDGFGSRARKVAILDSTGAQSGQFAYWVSDEGVKARINLKDKFDTAPASAATASKLQPSVGSPGAGGYYRLMVPQTVNFGAVDAANFKYDLSPLAQKPTALLQSLLGFSDMNRVGLDAAQVQSNFYHDITFESRGVIADVVNGGLKKDLTYYLTKADTSTPTIADIAGVTRSGIKDTDPIIYDTSSNGGIGLTSAKFGQLFNWARMAPGITKSPQIPLNGTADVSLPSQYLRAPFPYKLPDFSNTKGANPTSPGWDAPLKPVLAQVGYYFNFCVDGSGSVSNNAIKIMLYPRVVLWNPYSVPLRISKIRVHFAMENFAKVAIRVPQTSLIPGAPDKGFVYSWPQTTSILPLRFEIASSPEVLNPGETKCYVPASKAMTLAPTTTNWPAAPVWNPLVAGSPENMGSYLDTTKFVTNLNSTDDAGNIQSSEQPTANDWGIINAGGAVYRCAISDNFTKYNYPGKKTPSSGGGTNGTGWMLGDASGYWAPGEGSVNWRIFMLQGANNDVLEEMIIEPWTRTGNGVWMSPMNAADATIKLLPKTAASAIIPNKGNSQLVRLLWMDDATTVMGSPRNTQMNGFITANVTAARHMRYPTDMITWIRANHIWHSSMYTGEASNILFNDPMYIPNAAGNMPPLMSGTSASNVRLSPLDVPRTETGILSLGALQHMPVSHFAWAPALAVGNSFPSPGIMANQSALGKTEEKLQWDLIFTQKGQWGGTSFPTTILETTNPQLSGKSPLLIWDTSYEFNTALWDSYYFSGIGGSNSGWSGNQWDTAYSANPLTVMKNGRLSPSGATPPAAAYALYRAAATLMMDGAFNINSTSEAAWVALLSSFRDVQLPTRESGTVTSGSVYSRNIYPTRGAVTAGDKTMADTTWSGCRALTDAEIRNLARYIVEEVRQNGPFLGLADFVNRRLDTSTTPSDFNVWDKRYLGALQGAINRSGINAQYNDYPMNRTNGGDTIVVGVADGMTKRPYAEHRPPHKVAGAPGYLLQGDLLQQLGGVLTARSDTFKIRSVGHSDDGASVCVELTVQRFPEPIIADSKLAVNAVAADPAATGASAGPKQFGRRFKIIGTRWLDSSDI